MAEMRTVYRAEEDSDIVDAVFLNGEKVEDVIEASPAEGYLIRLARDEQNCLITEIIDGLREFQQERLTGKVTVKLTENP